MFDFLKNFVASNKFLVVAIAVVLALVWFMGLNTMSIVAVVGVVGYFLYQRFFGGGGDGTATAPVTA